MFFFLATKLYLNYKYNYNQITLEKPLRHEQLMPGPCISILLSLLPNMPISCSCEPSASLRTWVLQHLDFCTSVPDPNPRASQIRALLYHRLCEFLMKSFRRFITTWAGHLELGLHSSPVPTAFPHLLVHCVSQICILLLWPTCAVLSHSVVSDSLRTPGLYPARLLCPWDSPGKNTGVGCHALLQGIFPTPGLNPCFLYLLLWPNGTVIFPQRPNFLDYT